MNSKIPTTKGSVGILNVGDGDTKLSFDPNNPAERIRAARIVKDMLRRGYCLLVEVGQHEDGKPKYTRALDFDEAKCEYVIADFDPLIAQTEDAKEPNGNDEQSQEQSGAAAPAGASATPTGKRAYRKRTVDAGSTTTVAVARTAGG